jgi:Fe-S-cluster containining protein
LWTLEELDNVVGEYPDILENRNINIFKGDMPGLVYLISIVADDVDKSTNSLSLDYCSMYDVDNRRCLVYNHRPDVCKTYGDQKYASCPYENYTEDGSLTEALMNNKEYIEGLHSTAPSQPLNFLKDYAEPWLERFEHSKIETPEYYEWWQELPELNFIRS